jgi:hypothetical protein
MFTLHRLLPCQAVLHRGHSPHRGHQQALRAGHLPLPRRQRPAVLWVLDRLLQLLAPYCETSVGVYFYIAPA